MVITKFLEKTKSLAAGSACLLLTLGFAPLTAQDADIPQIALDSSGNCMAAWQITDEASGHLVQFNSKPSNGQWGTPQTVSTSGIDSFFPTLKCNDAGDAVIGWMVQDPIWQVNCVCASMYDHATATWSTPTVLSTSDQLVDQNFQVRINNSGTVLIGWKSLFLNTSENVMCAAIGTIGGGWGTSQVVSVEAE